MVLAVTTGSVDIVSSSSEEEPLSIVMAGGPLLATRKYDVLKGGVPLPAIDLADLKNVTSYQFKMLFKNFYFISKMMFLLFRQNLILIKICDQLQNTI